MESGTTARVRSVVREACRVIGVAVLLLALPGLLQAALLRADSDLEDPRNKRIEESYQYIKAHLEAPHGGYSDLPGLSVAGWKIAALSHMAAGLMSMAMDARDSGDHERLSEVSVLLEEVARRAVAQEVSPYSAPLEEIEDFNDWGFYLGHLSLTLGCARYISGTTEHDRLHGRIVRYQMIRMTDDGDFHSRSYPNSYKWPADQALTLAGANLYDRIHSTELAAEVTAGWLAEIDALSDGGLHPLALTAATAMPIDGKGTLLSPLPDAETPRGSALSPTIFYMAQFSPEESSSLYEHYRQDRLDAVLGFGGFREWPSGSRSDIEGGPVLFGLGSIASALGLAPARIYGDTRAYTTILRSALVAGVPVEPGAGRGFLLAPLLGEAILFSSLTARPWFSAPQPQTFSDPTPPAAGAWGLLLADLVLLVWLLWRPVRAVLARRRPAAAPEEMSESVTVTV